MDINSMRKEKYAILLEALCLGVPIKYGEDWQLIYQDDKLYEVSYNIINEKVSRKSTITLQEFIQNFKDISDKDLKNVYGNIRLCKLQRKLIEENK